MVLYMEGVGASDASPGGEVRIRRRHQSGVSVRDTCPFPHPIANGHTPFLFARHSGHGQSG